jgi:hypothetical protein
MENEKYLNKALDLAKETIAKADVQIQSINKLIPAIKQEIKAHNIEAYNQLSEMEKALKNQDIKKIIEIKNKLNAYNK